VHSTRPLFLSSCLPRFLGKSRTGLIRSLGVWTVTNVSEKTIWNDLVLPCKGARKGERGKQRKKTEGLFHDHKALNFLFFVLCLHPLIPTFCASPRRAQQFSASFSLVSRPLAVGWGFERSGDLKILYLLYVCNPPKMENQSHDGYRFRPAASH